MSGSEDNMSGSKPIELMFPYEKKNKSKQKCPYRADRECCTVKPNKYSEFATCQLCLMGQHANELSIMNSAVANLTASIEERLCREKQK